MKIYSAKNLEVYKKAYISPEQHKLLTDEVSEVGKMLGSMINKPFPFLIKKKV
jgi:hypothetical protein